jgi:ankyrin repeat protein
MKRILSSAALACLPLFSACTGPAAKPDATAAAPAAAPVTDGLSLQDRIDLFVHEARVGEIDNVKAGLAAGVPLNSFDTLGQNALIAALSYNSLDEVKLLLDHDADPNVRDHAGWTPLHFAAWFGSTSAVMQALLDHGAKINERNDRGITPLYFASISGHELQVRLLLEHGADRSIASTSGYTPLRAAQVKGYYAVVALLDPDAAKAAAAKPAAPAATGGTH